jgi:hypothetical protein
MPGDVETVFTANESGTYTAIMAVPTVQYGFMEGCCKAGDSMNRVNKRCVWTL